MGHFSDVEAYLGPLKKELSLIESENAKISNEIEDLTRTYVEGAPIVILVFIISYFNFSIDYLVHGLTCIADSNQLESDLEMLKHSVDVVASQVSYELSRKSRNLKSELVLVRKVMTAGHLALRKCVQSKETMLLIYRLIFVVRYILSFAPTSKF